MTESSFLSSTGISGQAVVTGNYRYALWRRWTDGVRAEGATDGLCLFVMLNPSTADAFVDDPTLKSCIRLAKGWGFGRLAVGNLYGWRSPKPKNLLTAPDPVGPDNDEWLDELLSEASRVVVAWGAGVVGAPAGLKRAAEVCWRLNAIEDGLPLWCRVAPPTATPLTRSTCPRTPSSSVSTTGGSCMGDRLEMALERLRPQPGDIVVLRLPEGDRPTLGELVLNFDRVLPPECRGAVVFGDRRLELHRDVVVVDADVVDIAPAPPSDPGMPTT